jgi:hypothetical protein
MNENRNIVRLRQQGEIDDPLMNILRSGARRLLARAVETEAESQTAIRFAIILKQNRSSRCDKFAHAPPMFAIPLPDVCRSLQLCNAEAPPIMRLREEGELAMTPVAARRRQRRQLKIVGVDLGRFGTAMRRISQSANSATVEEYRASPGALP